MNRIVFDSLVRENPKTYAFVTLPRIQTKHYTESHSEADRNAIYVNLPIQEDQQVVKKGYYYYVIVICYYFTKSIYFSLNIYFI